MSFVLFKISRILCIYSHTLSSCHVRQLICIYCGPQWGEVPHFHMYVCTCKEAAAVAPKCLQQFDACLWLVALSPLLRFSAFALFCLWAVEFLTCHFYQRTCIFISGISTYLYIGMYSMLHLASCWCCQCGVWICLWVVFVSFEFFFDFLLFFHWEISLPSPWLPPPWLTPLSISAAGTYWNLFLLFSSLHSLPLLSSVVWHCGLTQ